MPAIVASLLDGLMATGFRFGAKETSRAGHEAGVAGVFASVAGNYDLMNDVMSLGMHRCWKRSMLTLAAPRSGEDWLDLATGSGDIALQLAAPGRAGTVTAADPSYEMLEVAKGRCGQSQALTLVRCKAESLPFNDGSFDGVTCAFGLRNFTAPIESLREVARVLRQGGRLVVLEFCPPSGPLAALQQRYLKEALPVMGEVIASDAASYRYLAESIIGFSPPEQVASWLEKAGLVETQWNTFAAGAVALHRAWKAL